jgi:hypothetical protein
MANENKPKTPQGGGNVGDKARDLAATAVDKGREAASAAAAKAGDLLHAVGQKADTAAESVGGGIKSLGGTLRQSGPQEGMLGAASSAVAGALERGGGYLQEQGLSGIAEDFTELIKRNPIPALLIGIGVGFLLARATSRS